MGVSNHWKQAQSTGLVSARSLSCPGSGQNYLAIKAVQITGQECRAAQSCGRPSPPTAQWVQIGCRWLENPAQSPKLTWDHAPIPPERAVLMETTLNPLTLLGGWGSTCTSKMQQGVSGSSTAIFLLPQVLQQHYSTCPPLPGLENVKLGLKSKAEVSEVIYRPLIS